MTHDIRKKVIQLIQNQDFQAAETALEQLCPSNHEDAYLWFLRGAVNGQLGLYPEAIEYCENAVSLEPTLHDAWFNLAQAYTQSGEYAKAIAAYIKIPETQPAYCTILCNIGLLLQQQGKFQSAIDNHRKALEISPDNIDNLIGLGKALMLRGDINKAEDCYRKALRLIPGHVGANNHLGQLYSSQGIYTRAVSCFRTAIENDPCCSDSHINLALSLSAQAMHSEAEKHFLTALNIDPSNNRAHSAYLFSQNYYKDDRTEIADSHKRWAPESDNTPLLNRNHPAENKPIKVAYLSQDFRDHSVASFIEPILEAHSKDIVNVYCYADIIKPDNTTKRLKALAHHWRDIHGQPAENVRKTILNDGIDILVELGGHTNHELLTILSQRSAPIQITYLGYPNTTGMASIDYRITDSVSDPEPEADLAYTEKLIRMPDGFLCYKPPSDSPDIAPTPYLKSDTITFGSFNNFSKVTDSVIKCWASILNKIKNSNIVLKSDCFSDKEIQDRVHRMFYNLSIDKNRVLLIEKIPEQRKHLEAYNKIDIALDTFPYNGTATTCEALWMGVPVITFPGHTHASRVGTSILKQTGFSGWCATSEQAYIEKAVKLANKTFLSSHNRENTREIVALSSLCNKKNFTQNLENIYLSLWKTINHRNAQKS